jgi:hypothetical protein
VLWEFAAQARPQRGVVFFMGMHLL